MKNIILIFALFFCWACSIKVPLASPPQKNLNIENTKDKASNFILANEWMVEIFNNPNRVIQFSDKEEGIIIGRYLMKQGKSPLIYNKETKDYSGGEELYATITLRLKDNAARIEIDPPASGMYSDKSGSGEFGFTPTIFNNMADILMANFEAKIKSRDQDKDW